MPFASALSQHPLPTHAAGEVVGEVLEQLGPAPDVAVLFVGAALGGAIEDLVSTVRRILSPGLTLAVTTGTVVGGGREIEDGGAVALWAGRVDGLTPVRVASQRADGGVRVTGLDPTELVAAHTLVLMADPFSVPVDGIVDHLAEHQPHLTVIGGLASGADRPGGNRLALDDDVHADGAVGFLLSGATRVSAVVSQGCRPVGRALVVTRSEGNLVAELAGRPAAERLSEMVSGLDPDERELMRRGLHAGRVIDEHKVDFERGDFLIRNVMGVDPQRGVVAVGDRFPVGSTLQFQVRDATTADEDLRELLAGRRADGALLFTCTGRGTHLFDGPDHDAGIMIDELGGAAVAGMSCAGEIGPVGGRPFLHGFTASIALFHDAGSDPTGAAGEPDPRP